jgi:hypothetical protein
MSNEVVTIRIESEMFRRQMAAFAKKKDKEFRRIVMDAVLYLKQRAKERVRDFTKGSKVRSGFLINNIHSVITNNGLAGEVISRAEYSRAFEEGTAPHVVEIKNKRVLAGPLRGAPAGWVVSAKSKSMGYATYGKRIFHPGTKPHPFMFPSFKEAMTRLENNIKQVF